MTETIIKLSPNKILTPMVRCSYPNLQWNKFGDPKRYSEAQVLEILKEDSSAYFSRSIQLLFNKKDKEHMDFCRALVNCMKEFLVASWPDASKRPRTPIIGSSASPIEDEYKGTNQQGIPYAEANPETEGHYLIMVNMGFQIKNREAGRLPLLNERGQEITDASEFYGGCWVKCGFRLWKRVSYGKPGIGVGLVIVRKMKDDEPFGGGASKKPTDWFDDVNMEAENPANYDGFFGQETGGNELF